MDQSTSIVSAAGGYNNWNTYMLGFAQTLASSFPISPSLTQIGVIKFSYSATPAFSLNAYNDTISLSNAILNLELDGGETDIADGLRKTRFVTSLIIFRICTVCMYSVSVRRLYLLYV